MRKLANWVKTSRFGKVAVVSGAFLAPFAARAADPTDIAAVITTVDGYRTSAMTLGILIMLFVIGRSIVHKLAH